MTGPVLDLAYGRVEVTDHVLDVTPILEDIDSAPRRARARSTLADLVRRAGVRTAVLVPTVWGPVRTEAMTSELRAVGLHCPTIPRAVAIAASHADSATRIVVVETGLVPTTGEHWSAHTVTREDGRWVLGRGAVTSPHQIRGDPDWRQMLQQTRGVVVDGPDPDVNGRAVRLLHDTFGVRAAVVDRSRLTAFGGRVRLATGADLLAGLPLPPTPRRRRSGRALAGVSALLTVAAIGAAAWTHWPRATVPDRQTVQVGAAQFAVPGAWLRTDQATEGRGTDRAVFASPDDGRRLIVVVSRLRSGSTPSSVAESLRNRIAQRGDDAVAEFSADLDYAGRRVIGYRENPASGASVAWYVTVDGTAQISIGCQQGTGEASIDAACRQAVGSARARAD
ncbi:type VII secretion-associated protein [Gordonia hydrophobica]|uniref:Type VII secretion-associated protein n=1 Tax=Gordonia hydrophobica TaxID=40516 RepID=A0ABZ2U285_9ACTN|nr:type VII secretion-associated protein [Gordonia hydrophobica]MBM7366788.1 type VII secretion-associated protein (TIGR03931 family) [Gordonia hydrophobica]